MTFYCIKHLRYWEEFFILLLHTLAMPYSTGYNRQAQLHGRFVRAR